MEKDLPPKLDIKTLKQLEKEQLVEMLPEQAKAIEQLKSRVIELESIIEKLKVSRDLDSTTYIIKTTVGRHPQKNREKT
ncbi:MAG: hypothetical protein RM022_005345 [Nostoc sp. EfeVER01]|uniref:hypothetical protein n=1 Tax=unclassified Nostoc TaxID=2593658 RepID=UPI002AD2583B|nr:MULTISPECIES: hypothetical protein [unclassified Nostoc]MDZ7945795.1 hypothetical protein [Nostoc sp. EfeVER01]MDZ7995586.1 hypothetical protein [Nostoc sp. EspVER01]